MKHTGMDFHPWGPWTAPETLVTATQTQAQGFTYAPSGPNSVLLGPTPGAQAADLGDLYCYMPRIIEHFTKFEKVSATQVKVTVYYTLTTIPYYGMMMTADFLYTIPEAPHGEPLPLPAPGWDLHPEYNWPPGSDPGGAPWVPGDACGDTGRGVDPTRE